ncbi:MAG: hypothetical protein CME65_07960 [Halobacteriovoraceae bacterium]|nr:hypothetical protein [Halobacteriovoraceae bacterium]|tara:strand:+ start:5572 stop:6213 length:642 start_codon:yes stop_codon:yes gene_type:complete
MKFWKKFKEGLFTKTQFIVGVTLTMLTTSALVYSYQVLSLNQFTGGTTISATEVNSNFQQINEALSRVSNQFEVSISADKTLTTNVSATNWATYDDLDIDSLISDDTEFGSGAEVVSGNGFTVRSDGFYRFLAVMKANTASSSPGSYGYVYLGEQSEATSWNSVYLYSSSTSPAFLEYSRFLTSGEVIKFRSKVYSGSLVLDSSKFQLKVKKL